MSPLHQRVVEWMSPLGLPEEFQVAAACLALGLGLILLALATHALARLLLLRTLGAFVRKSAGHWDDALVENHVFRRIAHFAPGWILYSLGPGVAGPYEGAATAIQTAALIYMLAMGLGIASAVINAIHDIFEQREISRRIQITAFVQVAKLALFIVGGVAILAQLMGKSPLVLFSGLGAFTAVLILVFRDTILGLVAGIYLMSTQLVRRGDWIEMPQYGVDGDVLELNLMSVKVQNFDKTVVSVPSYALMSGSFRNWRGMQESGGRRIKRALFLDMTSVAFADQELLERLEKMSLLAKRIRERRSEIEKSNRDLGVDESEPVNGRRLTNVGCFRAYLERYLEEHPRLDPEKTLMVRQLAPSAQGLPMEIYCFAKTTEWGEYERIQADLFDHILAVVPRFGLRIFQEPAGHDLRRLSGKA